MRYLLLSVFPVLLNIVGFCQDASNGYKKFTYPNGITSSEGRFFNGSPDGYWKTYYVNGIIKSEGLWRNKHLDSTWRFYDNIGNLESEINYFDGKKNGYYLKYSTSIGKGSNKSLLISKELYISDRREGVSYYYSEDGFLQSISIYVDGKKEGIEKEFNKDSVIVAIREYVRGRTIYYEEINRYDRAGLKYGVWKEFYPNGKVSFERTFVNGKLNGYLKHFSDKGVLLSAVLYNNDEIVKDSVTLDEMVLREFTDSLGVLKRRGTYLGQTPVGTHYFFTNGNVDSCLVYDEVGYAISKGNVDKEGLKIGEWVEYYSGTRMVRAKGSYNISQKTGVWTYYFKNGKVEQRGNYRKNNFTGTWEWFDIEGNLLKSEEYLGGLRDGLYFELLSTGDTIAVGNYITGLKEGLWKIRDGKLTEVGNYVNDTRDGIWFSYYSNGNVYFKGSFNQGIADGKHLFYFENGKVYEEQFFSSGYPVDTWRKYDEDGFLKITVQYRAGEVYKINGYKVERL